MSSPTCVWKDDCKHLFVLKSLGMDYTNETVPLEKINWKESEQNMGRCDRPVIAENIDDYARAMASGAVFGKPIYAKDGDRYTIAAGLHRSLAAKTIGAMSIDAHVIQPKHQHEFRVIAVATNRMEGTRIGPSQAMAQALTMVLQDHLEPRDAAKVSQVSYDLLQSRLLSKRCEEQCRDVGFKGNLTDIAYRVLSPLKANDKVLYAAANHVVTHGLTGSEAQELVKAIRSKRTEAQQLASIEQESQRLRTIAAPQSANKHGNLPPPIRLPVRTTFLRMLHGLVGVVKDISSVEELQIVRDSDDHKDLRRQWKALRSKLNAIVDATGIQLDRRTPANKH